ncbi:MAG TPA: preprotein translocase subunit SecA [bacterium]|nr:preprotein translocase subunit SecA [bacterium]HQL62657.1 preprotein translocase subunit SecA [bacterium]
MSTILRKIFGTKQERDMRRYAPMVAEINTRETDYQKMTDAELREMTDKFRASLQQGEELREILPDAFAVVRETAKRQLNMRHFDVQLVGGMVLFEGKIAEMATGEGKTLVATLPAYLRALEGKGVHIVTVNDYLARRDREWMGPIYEALGLTVGVIQHDMSFDERQAAYACDITYGTNNELGFDYLRDNMAMHKSHCVQRELYYGIVDEVDSILIDEARTPLIISGPSEESTTLYEKVDRAVRRLQRDIDYTVDEKERTVMLTEDGLVRVQDFMGMNMFDEENLTLPHHVKQALVAHSLYHRDQEYIVKDGEVIIVDEFTGRLMPGRRYSDGLHQALEAKERLQVKQENQTLATITFQNFFRMYEILAGMTGTADTEAQEFREIYGLDVVVIPTNRPLRRTNHPDQVYRTEREKYNAIIEEIVQIHNEGRPILVGTTSIEKSERISKMLKPKGIKHQVLNAKHHEKEAEIVAEAGQMSAVTIATNMAGRGTDIKLGEGVAELGGLHILGTERHEARRIDNQLRGRAGRQGDPGSSRFFLSLEDDLMRIFGGERIKRIAERFGMQEGEVLEHRMVTRAIESAQKKVEEHNFDIRKHILKYDDVMNRQREVIYSLRKDLLNGEDPSKDLWSMCEWVIDYIAGNYAAAREKEENAQKDLLASIQFHFGLHPPEGTSAEEWLALDGSDESLQDRLKELAREAFDVKVRDLGEDLAQHVMSHIMLQTVTSKWKDHLHTMDTLREGVGLRAYGQKDPLIEYQQESYTLFEEMYRSIQRDVVTLWFRIQVNREAPPEKPRIPVSGIRRRKLSPAERAALRSRLQKQPEEGKEGETATAEQPTRLARASETKTKVGRNDPCPCGSGKKYKKCCLEKERAVATSQ